MRPRLRQTLAQGTVRLTGTKTLHGYVSGDPVEPIVPTTQDPATIDVQADFNVATRAVSGDIDGERLAPAWAPTISGTVGFEYDFIRAKPAPPRRFGPATALIEGR